MAPTHSARPNPRPGRACPHPNRPVSREFCHSPYFVGPNETCYLRCTCKTSESCPCHQKGKYAPLFKPKELCEIPDCELCKLLARLPKKLILCLSFLSKEGCKFGDKCAYGHPTHPCPNVWFDEATNSHRIVCQTAYYCKFCRFNNKNRSQRCGQYHGLESTKELFFPGLTHKMEPFEIAEAIAVCKKLEIIKKHDIEQFRLEELAASKQI